MVKDKYRREKRAYDFQISVFIAIGTSHDILYSDTRDDQKKGYKSQHLKTTYCRTHKSRYQVPIAELAERWTELPQVSDESRSFFRVHTGYFSNIPKCIKAEFIASWACSQSSVVSSSQR
ncbi:hypothetical protein TNCV_4139541 [Trichonephila clavipes]|nr:hypothetical protein TNCV_4139541 [Trichonephila clavipes]